MSNRLNLLFIGVLAVLMTGCGQTVFEKLRVTPEAPYNAIGQGKTVVILPFADYSDSDISTAQKRNIAISEAVMDKLALNGFGMPIPEDVFQYLVNEDIIFPQTKESSLAQELTNNEWSKEMKDILRGEISAQETTESDKGLTTEEIQKIGEAFDAQYVMRGRIIEYKQRQHPMSAPWKSGILPVVFGVTSRSLFGFIDADSYDGESFFLQRSATGEIELRIWVQDATTGEILWTNHTTIEASRRSVFADAQTDVLFTAAAKRSACLLVHDFAKYGVK